jgi:hypothetical protein
MQTAKLYDKQTGKEAVITRPDVTAADIRFFCEKNRLEFHAMGCPEGTGGEGWNDSAVFRVGTIEFPSRGVTIALDTVAEWTRAWGEIGAEVLDGGVYLYHKGGLVTTVCEATEEGTGKRLIVYRDEGGKCHARACEDFFRVVKDDAGRLVARYALMYARPHDQGAQGANAQTSKAA